MSCMFDINLANRTAAANSKRGMEIVFNGATRDFARNNFTDIFSFASIPLTYTQHPYATWDASENP
jgi:hypothetical protein